MKQDLYSSYSDLMNSRMIAVTAIINYLEESKLIVTLAKDFKYLIKSDPLTLVVKPNEYSIKSTNDL